MDWQHLNQADQESIKCKALLSSSMNPDIDPLEELALQSTTIKEKVNHPTSIKYFKHCSYKIAM